jgi:hypothetical protein
MRRQDPVAAGSARRFDAGAPGAAPADAGRQVRSAPKAVLVIGAHREELPFEEQVAAGLAGGPIKVLRIPVGISGCHPRQDQAFRYRVCHQELYLELRQQPKVHDRVLIDLHAGQDAHAPLADLLRHEQSLRDCVRCRLSDPDQTAAGRQRVRLIPLVAGDGRGARPVRARAAGRSAER